MKIIMALVVFLTAASSIFGASSFESDYEKKLMAPLKKEDAAEIAMQLGILQATIDALCIKSRGFSANVVSADFYEYHSFLNLTIEYLQKASYDVSERIRSLNAWANISIADIREKSKVVDARSIISSPPEFITELSRDYETASNRARGIFRMAATVGDAGTIALMSQTTFKLEHFLWEINVMAKGGKRISRAKQ
jgi:DNA-binding ferritin-like protein